MIHIKTFVFNSFGENTYLLYDESRECVIVDAGCNDDHERKQFDDFIRNNGLKPVKLLTTHCHVDHILGNNYILDSYAGVSFEIDKSGKHFLDNIQSFASVFGLDVEKVPQPNRFIKEGDIISFGNSQLEVLSTPGHCDGSLCFYSKEAKFVIVGDVLFDGGIGRSDLPSGNHTLLMKSINEKLMTLDDDVTVFCGHGPSTTIGNERRNNPFLND